MKFIKHKVKNGLTETSAVLPNRQSKQLPIGLDNFRGPWIEKFKHIIFFDHVISYEINI